MPIVKRVLERVCKPFPPFLGVLACARCRPPETEDRALGTVATGSCERCGVEVSTKDGTGTVVAMSLHEAWDFGAGH